MNKSFIIHSTKKLKSWLMSFLLFCRRLISCESGVFCVLVKKSIDQVPKLACASNGSAATSHDIYAASHDFS